MLIASRYKGSRPGLYCISQWPSYGPPFSHPSRRLLNNIITHTNFTSRKTFLYNKNLKELFWKKKWVVFISILIFRHACCTKNNSFFEVNPWNSIQLLKKTIKNYPNLAGLAYCDYRVAYDGSCVVCVFLFGICLM